LGVEEVKLTKKALGWEPDRSFYVPEPAAAHFRSAIDRGQRAQGAWQQRFDAYAAAFPDLAADWHRTCSGELPKGWDAELPTFGTADAQATRQAGGKVLNAIAKRVAAVIGGDADLSVSTSTALKDAGSFDGQSGTGRNLHFGVREHAMGGIANGVAFHGGVRPFVATFFCFSDYMRPSVRLAALNELPVIYVWTHDSIGLGEDGPTHQPVEHLMSLRAMPGLTLLRPADASEAREAWRAAVAHLDGPVGLVLSRQKLPVLDRGKLAAADGLARGAYVLAEGSRVPPRLILIGTGSEVSLALQAREQLEAEGIATRVVSMPSWELFDRQPPDYRESVLPRRLPAR